MAIPLEIPKTHLVQISRQIGERPAHDLAPGLRSDRRLAEHFEVWQLLTCQTISPGIRLEDIATRTRFTHHQIRARTRAVQFALSSSSSETSYKRAVHALFTSDLAHNIDRGIHWIDSRKRLANKRVRLLFVPSRQVYALWLYCDEQDHLLIVQKPNMGRALQYNRLHSMKAFFNALARRKPIMPGAVCRPVRQ